MACSGGLSIVKASSATGEGSVITPEGSVCMVAQSACGTLGKGSAKYVHSRMRVLDSHVIMKIVIQALPSGVLTPPSPVAVDSS